MIRGVILDLDGTVYWGVQEVPGATRFLHRLRDHGLRSLFVTNRANRTPAAICAHLRGYGVPCEEKDVLTAAQATAEYLRPGSVHMIGEDGLRTALEERGFTFTDARPDYVIISFDRAFDYEKLKRACLLIRAGAKFVATNPDKYVKTDEGILPGTGALVAAVAAGAGAEPLVIGKPEPLIFEMAVARLGMPADEAMVVGDNLETDIRAGARTGLRTALMLTGVSTRDHIAASPQAPTWVVEDYDRLWAIIAEENREYDGAAQSTASAV